MYSDECQQKLSESIFTNIPKPKAPVDFTEEYLQKRSSLSVLPQSYGHKIRNCYKIEVKKF